MMDIHELAGRLTRLSPNEVDLTDYGNGFPTACFVGHAPDDPDQWPSIGFSIEDGNRGDHMFSIHPDDIDSATKRLDTLIERNVVDYDLRYVFGGLRVNWD